MNKHIKYLMITNILISLSTLSHAGAFTNDPAYPNFKQRLVNEYQFTPEQVDHEMENAEFKTSILKVMSKPGESKEWFQYRPQFITEQTIAKGISFQGIYANSLDRAHKEYGVPPEVILGILGVETGFGSNKGSFRAIDALSTLAFKGTRRNEYFTDELIQLFVLSRTQKNSLSSIKSSYAGAIGYPQFMPSNIIKYGVDYDGDGKVDLANSAVDSIGSVANYLAAHGWKSGQPIGYPAKYRGTDDSQIVSTDLTNPRPASELFALGLTPTEGRVSDKDMVNGIRLMGETSPLYWITYPNYQVITTYNRSRLYATAVWQLGLAIKSKQTNTPKMISGSPTVLDVKE